MGGFGTWALAMKHPEEFAAIIPICGGGDTTDAWKIRNIPVWCFHGADDDIVPPAGSINMVNATKRFNSQVHFTIYANTKHNSWDTTYHNDSVYQWLLAQKKFRYQETGINAALLQRYQGHYLGPDGDTVQILADQQQLIAKPGKETVSLKPAGENLFFLRTDRNMDIRFNFENGTVTSFWFLGDRKLLYHKLKE
jgi:S-formylglutathione hydrolase FrmB